MPRPSRPQQQQSHCLGGPSGLGRSCDDGIKLKRRLAVNEEILIVSISESSSVQLFRLRDVMSGNVIDIGSFLFMQRLMSRPTHIRP